MNNQSSSSLDQVDRKILKISKTRPIYFLIGFVLISSLVAFIIGGFILGKEKNNKSEKEGVTITSKEIPNNPNNWKKYKLKSLGMEIKLPEELSKKGDWKERIISARKGSIICFSFRNSNKNDCESDELTIGGSSKDFDEGREGTFTDLQGFEIQNNIYFAKFVDDKKLILKDFKIKKFENENGVEIVKILGKNSSDESSAGNPGEGYLGAIINTKNNKYPGFTINMKIDSELTELEFDQILNSLKFTN